MKFLIAALVTFSLGTPALFAEPNPLNPPETIESLKAEIVDLKTALAKAKDESVTYFANSVALRSKFEAAVQRVNEANEVATQWRAQATTVQRELVYTRAIAQQYKNMDPQQGLDSLEAPKFRVSNILKQPNIITPRDAVAPTYVAIR